MAGHCESEPTRGEDTNCSGVRIGRVRRALKGLMFRSTSNPRSSPAGDHTICKTIVRSLKVPAKYAVSTAFPTLAKSSNAFVSAPSRDVGIDLRIGAPSNLYLIVC